MDSFTHIFLGANLGYACFGRRLGRTAALAGGLAAFVPDADIFIHSAQDPLLAVEFHRHFTHSFFFAPLGSAVVAALWLSRPAWRDRARWLVLWACCFVGYISHGLLDAATTYGTQLLWPLSHERFGWDMITIIDPLFTLMLLAFLLAALLRQRRRPAVMGLAVVAVWLAFGVVQHARVLAAQRQLADARGHTRQRVRAMPTLANNLVWRALYLHEGRIYSDRIRAGWFSTPMVREGWSLPLVREADLTAAEKARNRYRSLERFTWFSDGWVGRSPADATLISDMRYSLSTEAFGPIWGIRFTSPDAPTEVLFVNRSSDRRLSVKEMWTEISGGDSRFKPLPSVAAGR